MTEPGDLNWLLDSLVNQIAQVRHAIVLSADGLVVGASRGLAREDAEHLAALSSGFQSLAKTTADHFKGGAVRQSIVEMDDRFLFVTAAGSGACLSVLTDGDADVGVIAYEMAMLVTRVGRHLSARPREGAQVR